MPSRVREKRTWIEAKHPTISIRRQCELLGLNRSSWYLEPAGESAENLALMRQIDEQYLRTPFYGSRKMAFWLTQQGHEVNRKRVQRLMRTNKRDTTIKARCDVVCMARTTRNKFAFHSEMNELLIGEFFIQ